MTSALGTAMRIPFMRLDRQFHAIRDEIMPAVLAVLEGGRVLQGPEIDMLEHRLAEMHGLEHCVVLNSGTDALTFALAALGLHEGGRVAVPAMSFVASASAIVHNRCRPLFVDVDPDTILMDAEALLQLIRGEEVDAIVAVHLYGQMMDLREIAKEARERGIYLIEDAAQALGATRFGRPPGSDGEVTCLSFDPTKVIGAFGSGGAVMTNDASIARTVRMLRYHGQGGNRLYERPGFNSQMHSLQAAILDVKLDYRDQWQERRQEIAARYAGGLAELPKVRLLKTLTGNVHNFHKFVITASDRDALRGDLKQAGVQTRVHYSPPLHLQPSFAGATTVRSLPHAERAAETILSLPIYPELTDREIDYIVQSLHQACEVRC